MNLVRARKLALLLGAIAMAYPYLHGAFVLDLRVYLAGGRAALDGNDVYAPSVVVHGYGFTYPPFAAILFAGLAALPLAVAEIVTVVTFYLALISLISRSSPGLLRRAGASWSGTALLGAMLAAQPVWATLHDGQVNVALAALILVDLCRPAGALGRGTLVGVCAAIKLTPGIFVVYLLITRQWAAARNAVLSFGAVTGTAWALLPADSWQFWTHSVFDAGRVGDIARPSNQSLLGLTSREFGNAASSRIGWLVLAAVVTIAGLRIALRLTLDGETVLALAVVGVVGCLLSPVSWTHHWVWCVPLLAGLQRSSRRQSRGWRVAIVAGCVVFLVGCRQWQAVARVPGVDLLAGSPYVVVGAAVLVALSWSTGKKVRPRVQHFGEPAPSNGDEPADEGPPGGVRGVRAATPTLAAPLRRRALW